MARSPRLKILLTEGSSLSARHTLYALGDRYLIDLCDPNPHLCLGRFSRFVRACHRCPPFGRDPLGYYQFMQERLRRERYDILFPVHDQVYLLSRFHKELATRARFAVPEFASLQRLQTKTGFLELVEELGLPHPATRRIRTRRELEEHDAFPFYVKHPTSTAGAGVWHVTEAAAARSLAERLEATGVLDGKRVLLIQQPARGDLCVVQAVFRKGELLAAHSYRALAQGVGGSARARIGVHHPQVLNDLRNLGGHLRWHGALMLDYFMEDATQTLAYLEANPRIGETGNALQSGLNLCDVWIDVAMGRAAPPPAPPRLGVRTHSIMMGLLAIAEKEKSRRKLIAELWQAATGRGIYAKSADEITRPRLDPLSAIPAIYLGVQLLLAPRSAERIISKAVADYALTEAGMQAIAK